MVSAIEKAIVKTLIYADIFDYPLSQNEIFTYLINIKDQRSPASPGTGRAKIKNMPTKSNILDSIGTIKKLKIKKIIYEKDGYYFFRGKSFLVKVREQREKWSKEKLKIARKIASFIRFIPSVKLVGVTGALAVNNSKEVDDIDLLIVSKSGLLWTTRFLVTIICELLSVRRRPNDKKTNNKICLNMFVDEDNLSIPENERDLFSAHEVIQMKPIWERDDTYNKFLRANEWVREYLPNAIKIKNAMKTPRGWQAERSEAMTPPMVEELVKSFQLWYMKSRRTSEVIADGIIRFHPEDARVWVMKKYDQKISFIQNG